MMLITSCILRVNRLSEELTNISNLSSEFITTEMLETLYQISNESELYSNNTNNFDSTL